MLFNTKLNFTEEYNDNIFYNTKDEINSFISIINPELNLRFESGKNLILAKYGFYYTYYDNEEARRFRSKYHHNGSLNLNYFLTEKLEFKITSRQRYSDLTSIVDIDHEMELREKVLRSFNQSNLTYYYGLQRYFGFEYEYLYFKTFGDAPFYREWHYTQSVGGFLNHVFNARNSIASVYNYYFGKFFLEDRNQYLGRKRVHNGYVSYKYRINSSLSTAISYHSRYSEYPTNNLDEPTETRKHISHEGRNTLNYDISEILTSRYWIGYNYNRTKVLTDWQDYKTMTGGLNFNLHWNKLSVNAVSSYGIRENLYLTTRERLGDYKSLHGKLSTTIGSYADPLRLNLFVSGQNKKYKIIKTTTGEPRKVDIVYCGGEINIIPLKWVDLTSGYYKVHRSSNEKTDIYEYDNYRVYLKLTITLPSPRGSQREATYFEIDPESII